jgi:hypothetical protein
MKKILLTLVVIMSLTVNSVKAQKETKYKDAKVESDFVTIDLLDAVSTDAGTKFKLKIQNKTSDYIFIRLKKVSLL